MNNEIALKPSYWASVSGGKDSLFMLNLILHNLDKYPLNGVVHFELEIDYPFITDVINYMESECNKHNIPFVRIKPRISWYELYNKYGFPTRKVRWCNSHYKLDAKEQLKEFLNSKGYNLVSYIGYCADEKARYEKRNNWLHERYPLVEEGIDEASILEWARTVPVFNDYYLYNDRCGCMYCPMATMIDNAYLRVYYPVYYYKLIGFARVTEINRENELGRPFSVWQSNPKYNTEYRHNRIENKYVKNILEIRERINNEY